MTALASASLLLSACFSSDTPQVSDRGQLTSSLSIYGNLREELIKPWIDGFQTKHAEVKVTYSRASSTGLLGLASGTEPVDMILSNSVSDMVRLDAEKKLSTLPESIGKLASDADGKALGANKNWAGVAYDPYILAYDPKKKLADDLPENLRDLTRVSAGKSIPKVALPVLSPAFVELVGGMIARWGADETKQWFEDLKRSGAVSRSDGSSALAAVASGDADVALVLASDWYSSRQNTATAVAQLLGKPLGGSDLGVPYALLSAGLLGRTNEGTAQAFLEYVLSREAQELLKKESIPMYPLIHSAGSPELLEKISPDFKYDLAKVAVGDANGLLYDLGLLQVK